MGILSFLINPDRKFDLNELFIIGLFNFFELFETQIIFIMNYYLIKMEFVL